ncbi:YqaJ viral recombinase family protein [Silvanigrella sp.]|uniref:YqaJ viral recombinase family protein n=1 Tax=Silvanigrella sp. TaxID=2024976 RepID=UPI0037C76074
MKQTETQNQEIKTLNNRHEYIGSTEVAAIIGLSPYQTAYDVWCHKKLKQEKEFNDGTLERMYWGLLLEPILLEESAKRLNLNYTGTQVHIRHSEYNFLGSTADALTENDVIEAKTTGLFNKSFTEEIPIEYYVQGNFHCGMHKKEKCIYPVLMGGQKFRTYLIEFDENFYQFCVDECVKFWKKYVEGNDEYPAPADKINAVKDSQCVANENIIKSLENISKLKSKIKLLETEKEKNEIEVKNFMAENEILLDEFNKKLCTWKQAERISIDNKKLEEYLGDKFNEFKKTTTYRTFRM